MKILLISRQMQNKIAMQHKHKVLITGVTCVYFSTTILFQPNVVGGKIYT